MITCIDDHIQPHSEGGRSYYTQGLFYETSLNSHFQLVIASLTIMLSAIKAAKRYGMQCGGRGEEANRKREICYSIVANGLEGHGMFSKRN